MASVWLSAPGEPVSLSELIIPKARATALALSTNSFPFVQLLESRRLAQEQDEVLVLEVEVELGQRRVHDIRRHERVAVVFPTDDSHAPEVLALRESFPSVPHLNLKLDEFPKSLCVYEEAYDEVKLRWTPIQFVEDIRNWLALTARGQLHGDDQPLEPLLLGSPWWLILPPDLLDNDAGLVTIHMVDESPRGAVLIAEPASRTPGRQTSRVFAAMVVMGLPQPHGIIHRPPRTLFDLHTFTELAGVNLIETIRGRLRDWHARQFDVLNSSLIVVLVLPKTRLRDGVVESNEWWAFATERTVAEVGEDFGIWQRMANQVGLLLSPDPERQGKDIRVTILNPVFALTRESAARLNGLQREDPTITCVGLGALGSQVFLNMARSGYGRWTLVDIDVVLPHNLARHALPGSAVGLPKAPAMAAVANALAVGEPIAKALVCDVLRPGSQSAELQKALQDTQVILDVSTSVAVARYLAMDVAGPARRVSAFLSPSGADLVLLAEDGARQTPLDYLEMQYYRLLISDLGKWSDHLRPIEGRIRYANSCREVSSTVSQELVALHASVASRALRTALRSDAASIVVWRADPGDLTVTSQRVLAEKAMEFPSGEWTIRTDQWLMNKVMHAREAKLPNETGGVLIGSFDMQRKIIYVVDVLPSPPDSKEWPTVYIRGCHGLSDAVESVKRVTAGMLQYVGEWHSHPKGCSSRPSQDDRRAFSWLVEHMVTTGLAALMLIVGEDLRFYLGHM